MLEALRKQTGSWIVKAFLIVLALSFAVWGIGDIFRGPQDPTVAQVGAVKIRASDLQRQYTRTVERLRRMTGGQLDAEQARAFGAVEQALDALVSRAAMRQEIERLSLGVPDEMVRRTITNTPTFSSDAGTFDRMIYEAVLRQNRLSEDEYVAMLRGDLAQEQLLGSLAAGMVAPAPLVQALHDYRGERRVAAVVTIAADSVAEVAAPNDAEIEAFYRDHPDRFTAPEYRRITFVTMRPADLLDEVKVDQEEVREEYEYRLDEFTAVHRRDVDRIVFDDQATAQAAARRIAEGEDFLAVGAELTGQSEADMRLGPLARDDLVDEAVAEAAFALEVGAVSAPVETPFGWYLVRVNRDYPGGTRTFEEVAEEIRKELEIRLAADATYELSNRFEDQRAAGATLEEAARALNLEVKTLSPVDRRGLTREGEPVEGLPPIQDFLDEAFAMAAGLESELRESLGSIFYALRVDEIVPPALRPLAEVRDQVAEAWRAERRRERARADAEALAARAKAAGLARAAADAGHAVETTAAFTRDGRGLELGLSPDVVTAIFALGPGGVSEALALGPDRFVVAEVKEVLPAPPPAEAGAEAARIGRQLESGMQADVIVALDEALRRKYGVRVNDALVDSLF